MCADRVTQDIIIDDSSPWVQLQSYKRGASETINYTLRSHIAFNEIKRPLANPFVITVER